MTLTDGIRWLSDLQRSGVKRSRLESPGRCSASIQEGLNFEFLGIYNHRSPARDLWREKIGGKNWEMLYTVCWSLNGAHTVDG